MLRHNITIRPSTGVYESRTLSSVYIYIYIYIYIMNSWFFMDLPVSSFVSHSSLLTRKGVDLVRARDGFSSKWKSSVFFIVAILIAEVHFKQFLIHIAV